MLNEQQNERLFSVPNVEARLVLGGHIVQYAELNIHRTRIIKSPKSPDLIMAGCEEGEGK